MLTAETTRLIPELIVVTCFAVGLTKPFLLLQVLLDALEFVLEIGDQLGVAVVEKLAVAVLLLNGLHLDGVLAEANTFLSHYV